MASSRNVAARRPLGNEPVVDQYLASLGRHLFGATRDRLRVLEEMRSGLDEATDRNISRAMPAPSAAQAAVDELGSPVDVAAAFSGELATRLARRVLWSLLFTGPLVGIWWFLLFVPVPEIPPLGVLLAAIPVLPLVAAAVATSVVAIATTGSLIRWLPETAPKRAVLAATAVAFACILCDLTVMAILAFRGAAMMSEALPLAIGIIAILASAIRLAGSAWFLGECRRARAALVARP